MELWPLSERETQVMDLLCQGKRQYEISKLMKCTVGTVGTMMSRMRDKLGQSQTNVQAAVRYVLVGKPGVVAGSATKSQNARKNKVATPLADPVLVVQPAPQGDSLAQSSGEITSTDAASGGEGGSVQGDEHTLATSPEAGPTSTALGG